MQSQEFRALDKKIGKVLTALDKKTDKLDEKMDKMFQASDAKTDALDKKQMRLMRKWIL